MFWMRILLQKVPALPAEPGLATMSSSSSAMVQFSMRKLEPE